MRMERYVALLRGINVGGHRKVPMAGLRAVAAELGFEEIETYVASGNLVFGSDAAPDRLESMLEGAIAKRFGFPVDVIVRSARQWREYRDANPLPAKSEAEPNLVMICVGKAQATDADVERLRTQASEKEQVERTGDAIWLYFGNGAGRSKLGTGASNGVWTTRNWRTLVKLAEMLGP